MASKNNDPAFLFYSTDFYEGTRMMLPEERACYIDLMIYQHQHGYIPFDLKRVLMYCNGINEATLEATLKAKFVASVEGYVNLKLEKVISERTEFTNKQSINGTVGQFYKKAKALLSKKDYIELKELLSDNTNNQTLELIIGKEINKAMLEAMLIALHKHLEDENEDIIIDINNVSKRIVKGKFIKPTYDEVKAYCEERKNGIDAQRFIDSNDAKGWLVGKTKTPMKDWKAAIRTWEGNNPKQNTKLGIGETISEQGHRIYGNNRVVPMDAPPRPSSQHYWDAECKKWGIM